MFQITALKNLIPAGILLVAAILALSLGFLIGSAFATAKLQTEITSLTRDIGVRNTTIATCEANVRILENATTAAGRAREMAESVASELLKRDQKVVYRVKEIKASSCVSMVNQLKGVSP